MTMTMIEDPSIRVRLVNDEFLVEHGGRLRAGTAVEVDEKTAQRWYKRGIAEPARDGDLTARQQKLALIAQLQAEADELARIAEGNAVVPTEAPRRGRGA